MESVVRELTPDLSPALGDLSPPPAQSAGVGACAGRIGANYRTTPSVTDCDAFREIVEEGPPPDVVASDGVAAVGWRQLTPRDSLLWLDRTWRLVNTSPRR